ncbi:hypothetical protein KXW88_003824 [Aspergillus fumigatus]|nr:hypothetical protein KXW88_003824 [Aspergillus fumigatus]
MDLRDRTAAGGDRWMQKGWQTAHLNEYGNSNDDEGPGGILEATEAADRANFTLRARLEVEVSAATISIFPLTLRDVQKPAVRGVKKGNAARQIGARDS